MHISLQWLTPPLAVAVWLVGNSVVTFALPVMGDESPKARTGVVWY
jgi:hypothetical protein